MFASAISEKYERYALGLEISQCFPSTREGSGASEENTIDTTKAQYISIITLGPSAHSKAKAKSGALPELVSEMRLR